MNHALRARTTELPVRSCAGVPITTCSPAEATGEILRLATADREAGVDVHLCSAHGLALADKDPALSTVLNRASINFPDGKSVVWANRILHRRQHVPSERVYGPDLFLDVFDAGQQLGLRHYLLGSTPEVLQALQQNLRRRFPQTIISGAESPPFRQLDFTEQQEQKRRIQDSGAQIVWVGLGTPKQDWEVARLRAELPMVAIAVGAAFDFVSGTKKQAPGWMQRHGLEWVYRLATEPRRLWRRYLFGNTRFVYACIRRARS